MIEKPTFPLSRFPTFPLSHFHTCKGFTPHHFWLKNGAGFSLLEVMIAVVVLGFGLLAIMHLFPIGLRASKVSQDTTVASFLAQAKIEELRNTGWNQLSIGATTEPYEDITDYPGFKRVTTVNNVETTDPGLKRITVEVFYKPYGAERSVKLVTLFTDYKKTM